MPVEKARRAAVLKYRSMDVLKLAVASFPFDTPVPSVPSSLGPSKSPYTAPNTHGIHAQVEITDGSAVHASINADPENSRPPIASPSAEAPSFRAKYITPRPAHAR